jgi:PAS domain S-box-containing protein
MVCSHCGTTIADKALVCYRCGAPTAAPAPVRPAATRRSGLFVSALALVVLVVGALWNPGDHLIMLAAAINTFVLLTTIVLRAAVPRVGPRTLRGLLLASFLIDVTLEVLGLMASGLTHSSIVMIPLISLMTVALILEVRDTIVVAAFFFVAYPAGAWLVATGSWTWTFSGPGASPPASVHSFLLFVVIQEAYFSMALGAFLFLVTKLRGLHRRFADDLEAATARIAAEISERQQEKEQAEEAIRRRERDYRLLADNVTDLVTLCNSRLEYTFVSPSAGAVLGYQPSELCGTSLKVLVHAEDWPLVERMLEGNRGEGEGPARELVVEYRARHKDGTWKWLETRGRTMPDGTAVLSSRDVTERRALEEQMRQAQKLESLGLLAGGVAHDFNNILLGIMGNAELAAMEQAADSPVRRHLLAIVSSAKRAARLCKQMLTYSGKGGMALAPVNLNDIIQEIPALLKAAIPKKARLSFKLDPRLPFVEADAAQIQQVAMNLIINAAEALPEAGGVVEVESSVSSLADHGRLGAGRQIGWPTARPDQKYVCLTVTDDGCGMDDDTLQRMFDPFFSTKFAGRGLGLSAVAGIIKGHHGVIQVSSQPSQGTRVTVAFPLRQVVRRRHKRSSSGEAATPWRGSGTVLVIDDEPGIVDIVSRMLVKLGFRTLIAQCGAEGIALFEQHAQEIVFVLCDYAMPQMDGVETIEAMKRLRPDLDFVMTSGLSEAQMKRSFADSGVKWFLQKPFSFEQLMQMARKLCSPE